VHEVIDDLGTRSRNQSHSTKPSTSYFVSKYDLTQYIKKESAFIGYFNCILLKQYNSNHPHGLPSGRNMGTHLLLCVLRQWLYRPCTISRFSANARHRETLQVEINSDSWWGTDCDILTVFDLDYHPPQQDPLVLMAMTPLPSRVFSLGSLTHDSSLR